MQLTLEDYTQRWRDKKTRWRPAGEVIDTSRYGVELIPDDNTAKAFVEAHHYSGSYPAARVRVGLYRAIGCGGRGVELVGVAVFSVPCNNRVIPSYVPGIEPLEGVELGRFVLLDDVPGNGETWFLARAFKLLKATKPELRAVLAYSDPVARCSLDGRVVLPGHIGTIYQAHNAHYMGRSSKRGLWLGPDGRALSPRLLSKIRLEEQGMDYAAAQLLAAGAPPRHRGEAPSAWVARALKEGPFRKLRHPGNHAYVWPLERRLSVDGGEYPKMVYSQSLL